MLIEQVSLPGFFYIVGYWAKCTLQLFVNHVVNLIFLRPTLYENIFRINPIQACGGAGGGRGVGGGAKSRTQGVHHVIHIVFGSSLVKV